MTLIALIAVGCDSGFEEINQNPNDPLTISPNLLLGQIEKTTVDLMYSTFNGGDMGSCWSQQLSKIQYNDEERFNPRQSSISSVWNTIYASIISDANSMYKLGDTEGNNNIKGVALVMQAYGYLLLTDLYGDIPFTEAMLAEGGNITPVYNTQEDVYDGVLNMLDEAALLLGTGGTIESVTDIVYGGNVNNWERFANSLKFRALMRISKKMNVSSQLQALIDEDNMFTSNVNEAKFTYKEENPNANPIYEGIVFGTRKEWKVCEVFVNQLVNTNDPRLPQMVDDLDDDQVYRGKPSGIADVPNDDYNVTNVSAIGPHYLRGEAPGYYMSYSELEFLIAEAITRADITLSAGSASDHYNAGILSSVLSAGANAGLVASFQADAQIALTGDEVSDLGKIATQNWVGLFLQGFESFIEQRRTGFPVIPMPIDAYISDFPVRLNYPNLESSINGVNYDAAIQRQGPDLLTTKMWRLQ